MEVTDVIADIIDDLQDWPPSALYAYFTHAMLGTLLTVLYLYGYYFGTKPSVMFLPVQSTD